MIAWRGDLIADRGHDERLVAGREVVEERPHLPVCVRACVRACA